MVDRLGSFEQVVAELAGGRTPRPQQRSTRKMELSEDARAERDRIKTILTADVSNGRRSAAENLAFATMLSADEALALLATLPAEQPAAAAPAFSGRSQDAPGGLVTADMLGGSDDALVRATGPIPAGAGDPADLWAQTIAQMNSSEAAKPAAAASADRV